MKRCVYVGALLFVLVLPSLSWAAMVELIDLVDISKSTSAVFEEEKKGVELLLDTVPPGTCVRVLGITEESFGDPLVILPRRCVLGRQYLLDSRPQESRRRIIADWGKQSQPLRPNRPATDVFGAMSYAALLFPKGRDILKFLVIHSDLRHNAHGIDLEGPSEIDPQTLRRIREKGPPPDLHGVRVWFLSVHTRGKNSRYFQSLQHFWVNYVVAAGGSVEAFTPSSRWEPDFGKATGRVAASRSRSWLP